MRWWFRKRQPTLEELRERCPDVIVARLCERYDFTPPWPEDPDEVPCWRQRDDEWSRATGIPVPCVARTLREFLLQNHSGEIEILRRLRAEASARVELTRIASAGTVAAAIQVEPEVGPLEPPVGPVGPAVEPAMEPQVEPHEKLETTGVVTVPSEIVEPIVEPLEPEVEPLVGPVGPEMGPRGTSVEPQPVPKRPMPALVVSNSGDKRQERALEWISNYHQDRAVWPSLQAVMSNLGLPKSTAYRYLTKAMSKEVKAA